VASARWRVRQPGAREGQDRAGWDDGEARSTVEAG